MSDLLWDDNPGNESLSHKARIVSTCCSEINDSILVMLLEFLLDPLWTGFWFGLGVFYGNLGKM